MKDCLLEKELAVPLVLLMAQQGNCVVYQVSSGCSLSEYTDIFTGNGK